MKHRNFKPRITRAILSIIFIASPIFAADLQPIVNVATEQKLLIPKTPDGGLPPLVGVQNIQVFRASKGVPELAGWTYNHHMDLAQWHGRLYLAWTNGEKDEDVWPAHEMLISSEDGFHWSAPAELFPQGMSTSLRTYFYHAKNGRMLAIAGHRMNTDKLAEANKGGIIVREIRADHTLAAPYILQDGPSQPKMAAPKFDTAADPAFVEACHLLLADHTFLYQQDFGSLLGKNRMAVYTGADKDFGRAMCFFHRPDGTLVGIGKKAWEILSTDEGKTWSTPQTVKSLITGNAKVWVQRTSDGQFAMIYNPTASDRFPLVAMTSADGITFNNMRLIHGDVAPQRYEGANRSVGPQYTRGISEWASDGSTLQGPAAGDMWIVYSSSKEDIWVSHIPVPFKLDQSTPVKDDLSATPLGGLVPGWNTYGPKWGGVSIAEAPDKSHAIKLEDRDPYDYAKAERVFSESANPAIHFQLLSTGVGSLEIELHTAFGEAHVHVRLILADGKLSSGATQLATIPPNQWLDLSLAISPGLCAIAIPGQSAAILPFAEPAQKVARLTFRTGPYRPVAESKFIDPATDKPTPPALFFVKDVTISG